MPYIILTYVESCLKNGIASAMWLRCLWQETIPMMLQDPLLKNTGVWKCYSYKFTIL